MEVSAVWRLGLSASSRSSRPRKDSRLPAGNLLCDAMALASTSAGPFGNRVKRAAIAFQLSALTTQILPPFLPLGAFFHGLAPFFVESGAPWVGPCRNSGRLSVVLASAVVMVSRSWTVSSRGLWLSRHWRLEKFGISSVASLDFSASRSKSRRRTSKSSSSTARAACSNTESAARTRAAAEAAWSVITRSSVPTAAEEACCSRPMQ